MRKILSITWLLCAVLVLGTGRTYAQGSAPHFQVSSVDFGIMASSEHTKIANASCQCFWLAGGSAEGAITFYHGLGLAAELNGGTASNIAPGVDLSKLTFATGPRYTSDRRKWKITRRVPLRLFGQGLFGDGHAFNGVFPVAKGTVSHASSFSMQFGGGADLGLWRGLGVRLVELQYVRTGFPNDYSNTQDDLRISAGMTWRIETKRERPDNP
jgi:outer membrane immunogenic protein